MFTVRWGMVCFRLMYWADSMNQHGKRVPARIVTLVGVLRLYAGRASQRDPNVRGWGRGDFAHTLHPSVGHYASAHFWNSSRHTSFKQTKSVCLCCPTAQVFPHQGASAAGGDGQDCNHPTLPGEPRRLDGEHSGHQSLGGSGWVEFAGALIWPSSKCTNISCLHHLGTPTPLFVRAH